MPESHPTAEPSSDNGNKECEQRIAELEALVKGLEAQVRALEVYKHKWEGHIEAVRAQGSGLVSMPVEKKRSA